MSGIELEKMKKDDLVVYTKDLIAKYSELANMYNALITKTPETVDNSGMLLEIEDLKNEISKLKDTLDQKEILINNLLIESKNLKINDINALKKTTDNDVSVQLYKVMGYENRVDNSKAYGGREFEIATIMVKYDDGKLTWDVDFKGSELFEPYKESFSNILNEAQKTNLLTHVKIHGWYTLLKSVMAIPSDFNSESFFEKFKKHD